MDFVRTSEEIRPAIKEHAIVRLQIGNAAPIIFKPSVLYNVPSKSPKEKDQTLLGGYEVVDGGESGGRDVWVEFLLGSLRGFERTGDTFEINREFCSFVNPDWEVHCSADRP